MAIDPFKREEDEEGSATTATSQPQQPQGGQQQGQQYYQMRNPDSAYAQQVKQANPNAQSRPEFYIPGHGWANSVNWTQPAIGQNAEPFTFINGQRVAIDPNQMDWAAWDKAQRDPSGLPTYNQFTEQLGQIPQAQAAAIKAKYPGLSDEDIGRLHGMGVFNPDGSFRDTPAPQGAQGAQATQQQGYKPQPFNIPPPPKPPAPPPPPPDFAAIIGGMPQLGELPQYQTPDGAFAGEGMLGDLEQFAREWMANPNRYATPYMDSVRELLDRDTAAARETGSREIAEWAASRGLVGSSYEGEQRLALEDQLDRNSLAKQVELMEMLAMIDAQDRSAAGGFGLDVGQYGRGVGSDRRDEARYAHEAEFRNRQLEQQDSLARAELSLNAAMAGDRAAMDRVQAELDQFRAIDAATLSRSQLELQNRQIEQRAWEIQQEMSFRGQQLTLEQAKLQADIEHRNNQLRQQGDQFDQSMDLGWMQAAIDWFRSMQGAETATGSGGGVPALDGMPGLESWMREAGSYDGERKRAADGKTYRWDASAGRWMFSPLNQ